MQIGKDINYDLENSPLQIKTDSVDGSDEGVMVNFFTASDGSGNRAGGVYLAFLNPPKYSFSYCTRQQFFNHLPSETDKVWTISLTRNSGEKRVVVHCNSKEVVNFELSGCSKSNWESFWKNNDVAKIHFASSDTASDFYRPGKHLTYTLTYKCDISSYQGDVMSKNVYIITVEVEVDMYSTICIASNNR